MSGMAETRVVKFYAQVLR